MPIMQHILELVFFAIIFMGPIPLCLTLLFVIQNEKEKSSFSHNMLILTTSWCIIETSIGLLLGISHYLTLSAVLLAEIFIFISGIIFLIYFKRQKPSFSFRDLLKLPKELNNLEKLIIGVLCFIGLVLLWILMTCPIKDYDSLAYHLPVMAKWYQSASFPMLEQFRGLISRYPYNWEVLCTLFLTPFREDFLVAFPNLIAWLLLGLSVYLLSLKIGAKRIHGLTASALVLTLPIVLLNVNTMHIDLPIASFFMVCLYFIVSYFYTRNYYYLGLFLAALGMLLGIKTSGIIYGFLLIIIIIFIILKHLCHDKRPLFVSLKPYKFIIPFSICCVLSFLLLGGFWYLRNFVELGNPIGNIKVQIGNIMVFPGAIHPATLYKTTLAKVFNLTDISHWKIFISQIDSKLGIPFLVLVLLFFFFLFTPFFHKKSIKIHIFLGLMALLISTLALYWTTPYSGSNRGTGWQLTPWFGQAIRYAFPFIGVLGIASAAGSKFIRIRSSVAAAIVFICCIPIITLLPKHFVLNGNKALYITILLLIIYEVYRFFTINKPRVTKLLVSFLIPLIIVGTFFVRQERDRNRTKSYGGVIEYIEKNTRQDEVIGYLFSHRSYLFYGKNFNRRVMYIPSRGKSQLKWLNLLRQKGVEVIATGPLRWNLKFKKEIMWLNDPDGSFIRVFGKNPIKDPTIYRIKNSVKVTNRTRSIYEPKNHNVSHTF